MSKMIKKMKNHITRIKDNPEKSFKSFFKSREMSSVIFIDAEDRDESNAERKNGDLPSISSTLNARIFRTNYLTKPKRN